MTSRAASVRPMRVAAPLDPSLPGTRLLADPRLLFEALSIAVDADDPCRVSVLKHKPGRRLAARVTCGRWDLLVKAFAGQRGWWIARRTSQVAAALARAGSPVIVSAPLAYLPCERTLIYPWRKGIPLLRAIRKSEAYALGSRTADTLRLLHTLGAGPLASEFDVWTVDDEARTMVAKSAPLSAALDDRHCPDALRVQVAREIARLRAPWPPALLHRDLYPDQVIVAGSEVHLIDLDDAALGIAWIDVANFRAHVELEILRHPAREPTLRSLAAGFLDAWPSPPPQRWLDLLEAGTLIRLAGLAVERRSDPTEAERLLSLAERRLDS
jgi:Ser/Thr protein kinase RdoA (MazF antagonist)